MAARDQHLGVSHEGDREFWRVPATHDRSSWRVAAVSDRSWRVAAAGRARGARAGAGRSSAGGPPGPGGRSAEVAGKATSWQVPSLGGPRSPHTTAPAIQLRHRPKPAQPLVVGYVPTTVHAHHPSPQIAARAAVVPEPEAPTPDDLDPLAGFLAALRRHLSADETTIDVTAEDEAPVEVVQTRDMPPADAMPPDEPAAPAGASGSPSAAGSEHGDRGWFLAGARERLAGGIPTNPVHPPPPTDEDGAVPEPSYANLDPDDLVGTFIRAVEDAGGVCHRVEDEVPDTLLDQLVTELNAWDIVVSAEPEAVALGERLAGRGVEVTPATPEAAAHAALGVTSAVAGIAVTGSVVLDSRRAGGRLASLLPAVHLCVLPVERLVATPGDLLRTLGADPSALPSALVIETGPSRTGDIEQLLTLGAHGPTHLHVVVVG
jgi:L-lactate dehydrogenase complex protein LldG